MIINKQENTYKISYGAKYFETKERAGEKKREGIQCKKITAQALSEGMAFQDSKGKKEADTQREGVRPF